MKIVVVGGSGLIGSKLVTMLTRDGHEVVAASRRSGVDAVTGEDFQPGFRAMSWPAAPMPRRRSLAPRS
jgi:uncharacterized protein YbjT (DUF2867 family)